MHRLILEFLPGERQRRSFAMLNVMRRTTSMNYLHCTSFEGATYPIPYQTDVLKSKLMESWRGRAVTRNMDDLTLR